MSAINNDVTQSSSHYHPSNSENLQGLASENLTVALSAIFQINTELTDEGKRTVSNILGRVSSHDGPEAVSLLCAIWRAKPELFSASQLIHLQFGEHAVSVPLTVLHRRAGELYGMYTSSDDDSLENNIDNTSINFDSIGELFEDDVRQKLDLNRRFTHYLNDGEIPCNDLNAEDCVELLRAAEALNCRNFLTTVKQSITISFRSWQPSELVGFFGKLCVVIDQRIHHTISRDMSLYFLNLAREYPQKSLLNTHPMLIAVSGLPWTPTMTQSDDLVALCYQEAQAYVERSLTLCLTEPNTDAPHLALYTTLCRLLTTSESFLTDDAAMPLNMVCQALVKSLFFRYNFPTSLDTLSSDSDISEASESDVSDYDYNPDEISMFVLDVLSECPIEPLRRIFAISLTYRGDFLDPDYFVEDDSQLPIMKGAEFFAQDVHRKSRSAVEASQAFSETLQHLQRGQARWADGGMKDREIAHTSGRGFVSVFQYYLWMNFNDIPTRETWTATYETWLADAWNKIEILPQQIQPFAKFKLLRRCIAKWWSHYPREEAASIPPNTVNAMHRLCTMAFAAFEQFFMGAGKESAFFLSMIQHNDWDHLASLRDYRIFYDNEGYKGPTFQHKGLATLFTLKGPHLDLSEVCISELRGGETEIYTEPPTTPMKGLTLRLRNVHYAHGDPFLTRLRVVVEEFSQIMPVTIVIDKRAKRVQALIDETPDAYQWLSGDNVTLVRFTP